MTIPAGQTSATVVVDVLTDAVPEPTETFRLNIGWSVTAGGTLVGRDIDNGWATITDND